MAGQMSELMDQIKVGDVFYAAYGGGFGSKIRGVVKYTVVSTPKTMIRVKGDNGVEDRVMRRRYGTDGWPLLTSGGQTSLYPEGHPKVAEFQAAAARSRALSQAGLALNQAQKALRAEDIDEARLTIALADSFLDEVDS